MIIDEFPQPQVEPPTSDIHVQLTTAWISRLRVWLITRI
jgi:hypothetical protein